jgi:anhydro-N-acetylmuramic acid kinase
MFAHAGQRVAVVNVGGMANATLLGLDRPGHVSGFDTGPGNVLMDLWCERHTGQRFDANGAWAASGQSVPALLARMQQDPYFSLHGPRSTGRDHFNARWLDAHLQAHLGAGGNLQPQDVQATLCALTTWSIARTLPSTLDKVVVCGGGSFNATLMSELARQLGGLPVVTSDALGLPAMQVEAAAFAWLAMQTLAARPGNVKEVTGAAGPRILGAIYPA